MSGRPKTTALVDYIRSSGAVASVRILKDVRSTKNAQETERHCVQFKELQRLRQKVRSAEFAAEHERQSAGENSKVGGRSPSPQKPGSRGRTE
jgi:hypothetical protein